MPKKAQGIDGTAGEIIKARGYRAGPKHLERDLKSALGFYLMDGGRWRALDALALVVVAIFRERGKTDKEFDGIHPKAKVQIPWWVARSIFITWMEWREEERERVPKIKLGQAFEIERPQRGKLSAFEIAQREERDMRLALLVAEKRPLKLEAAVADAASQARLKERTVWNAWKKYGDPATQATALLQNKRV